MVTMRQVNEHGGSLSDAEDLCARHANGSGFVWVTADVFHFMFGAMAPIGAYQTITVDDTLICIATRDAGVPPNVKW